MSAQESKLDLNKDHKTFAQICTIIQSDSLDIQGNFDVSQRKILAIFKILQQNVHIINYQIPDSEYYKINKPKLIGYTALHLAVEERKSKIIQMLLKFGADFTMKNNNNETALHHASQNILEKLDNYWGIISKDDELLTHKKLKYPFVDLLLSAHTFFSNTTNPSNSYGISHFHIACLMNDIKTVQLFLQNGVPINQAVDSNSLVAPGYTPLHFAARFFGVETLEILIEKGADIFLKDARKMNPLHLLVKRNIDMADYIRNTSLFKENFESNKQMIKLLLGKTLSEDFHVDDIGFSNFHAACTLQDVALVMRIFEKVSDLNHAINKDSSFWTGYTALHFAAHFDVETVQFLVNKGGDILVKDHRGVTPLDILLQKCDVSDFTLLIRSQPQWKDILFSDDKTKLVDLIFSMQTADDFESFLSKVSDVNMFVPFNSSLCPGYTPLHLAVLLCNTKNYYTFYEDTCMINCYGNYESEIKNENSLNEIQVCLKLGADVTAQDIYGSTAVHLAFRKARIDIVDELLKKQSNICQTIDRDGLSHLHMAFAVTLPYTYDTASTENAEMEYDRCIALLSNQVDKNTALKSKFIAVYKNSDGLENLKTIYANVGSTPLHFSVQAGNTKLTEKLLTYGYDTNSEDVDGFTPIHQLLTVKVDHYNDGKTLQELLFSSNPTDCKSNCGLNYLHVACHVKSEKAVNKLLDCGTDVNAAVPFSSMDSDEFPELINRVFRLPNHHHHINSLASTVKRYANYTPLHFAVESEYGDINYEIVDALLQRQANMLAKKVDGSVLFYEILAKSDRRLTQVFMKELERNGQCKQLVEEDSGITILHLACEILDLDTVERLLKSGGNVNAHCFFNSPIWPGYTPLHILMVISSQCLGSWYDKNPWRDKICSITKILLDHGAEITIQNAHHKTPLHQSFQITELPYEEHELRFTRILLKYHKDFGNSPTDDRGISHFHIACMCNDVTTVKSFLQRGVDVNQATNFHIGDYGGYTPLHFAVIHQFEEITHLLLQYNADVNATSCLMDTPLHLAFTLRPHYDRFATQHQSETKYLEILLSAGAKPNEKNIRGETPLEKLLTRMEQDNDYKFVNEEIVNTITKYAFRVNLFYPRNDKGFIGSILCNRERYAMVLQNPVFQAVLKTPDMNGPDLLGRSVIHNVVGTGWLGTEPSTADYISIIEKLTQSGFEINHRDKTGFTPLHTATNVENLSAIESLLMHGANVNIVDANSKVAYAHGTIWNNWDDYDILEEYQPIHKMFHRHFNKMSRFNLYINASNEKLITEAREEYHFSAAEGEEERHEAQITDESNRLKNTKIEPYSIKLYDFLCETGVVAAFPFMLQPKREVISKFFQEEGDYLRKNFPELTGILYFQYRKALEREVLVQPATVSLDVLIDFELPILCSENILKFLTNSELKRLIATKKLCNPTSASS